MSVIVLQYVFAAGNTIIASQHNTNNSTIYNMFNGGIDTTNISPTAGILYSQLNLGGSIVNADISPTAAIAGTKIASIATTQLTGILPTSLVSGTTGSNYYVLANGTSLTTNQVVQSFVPNNIKVFTSSTTWKNVGNSVYVKIEGGGGTGSSSGGSAGVGGGGSGGSINLNGRPGGTSSGIEEGQGGFSIMGFGDGGNGTGVTTGGGGAGGYAEGIITLNGSTTSIIVSGTNSFNGITSINATKGGNSGNSAGSTGGTGAVIVYY